MNNPKIIFMGTPDFALPALEALHQSPYTISAVVTQPDRPAGRGQKELAPPVKRTAQQMGLTVFQPQKVKEPSFLEILSAMKPDVIVVAAFGQILPKTVIELPRLGCLNIHPSLLPKYRGAAPLNWSIIRGESVTGVTIMLMDEGMDSGDILMQETTPLEPMETFGDLHDRLSRLGAGLLMQTLSQIIAGTARRIPQDPAGVTFAPRLTKETGNINWRMNVQDIVNLIRGLSPSPTAYTTLDHQILKVYAAAALPGNVTLEPGSIGSPTPDGLPVAAADGWVLLKDVQLSGKKRMCIRDFLRGYRLKPDCILGRDA